MAVLSLSVRPRELAAAIRSDCVLRAVHHRLGRTEASLDGGVEVSVVCSPAGVGLPVGGET